MSVSVEVVSSVRSKSSSHAPQFTAVTDLLLQAARHQPHQGLRFLTAEDEQGMLVAYPSMLNESYRILGGLRSMGCAPGSNVALLLSRARDVIPALWACLLGGYLPCPIAPIRNDPQRWAKHLEHVCELLDRPLFVSHGALMEELPAAASVADIETLRASSPSTEVHPAQPEDPALLMLTSGSTGHSKAVILTHGALLASLAGKVERQLLSSTDTVFNWIAFDHVAALLESHLFAQYVGASQIHVDPVAILADPLLFLRVLDRHCVTVAFTPNFLLGTLNGLLQSPSVAKLHEMNLRALRYIISGGEANVVETGRTFLRLLAPLGLSAHALRPAFGMTETSAASVYSHDFFLRDEQQEFAAVGLPIRGMQLRIVDDQQLPAPQGQSGHLQVKGPMVFTGYYRNAQATADAFTADGWFRTGDLGRIDEHGRLNLVGRSKDCIIVSGVNYPSHQLESALESLAGIKSSFVAAFAIRPKGSDTEQLVVAFATSLQDDSQLYQLISAIRSTTVLLWGFRPALIVPLPTQAFPKTSLGKIQRSLLRERFLKGELAPHEARVAALINRELGGYASPETDAERDVALIYASIFGVEPDRISATANFFDLGGTSLDLLQLQMQMKQRLGREIPLVNLLQSPTVRGLAAEDQRAYDPIVPLQLTGAKTPLFCVHPGTGDVLGFVGLANYFTQERPFYALRARGFEQGETYFASLTELVETYVRAIRLRQPHGPYAIAGYSFGGPVAFEIAKAIEQQGERVAFLGCIDETAYMDEPANKLIGPEHPVHVAFLFALVNRQQLVELPQQLRALGPSADACAHIMAAAPAERVAELQIDLAQFRSIVELSSRLVQLARSYTPGGTVDTMTVFYAEPFSGGKEAWLADLRRWHKFTRKPVRYIDVSGEHHSLMTGRHLASFQHQLRSEIDHALDGR